MCEEGDKGSNKAAEECNTESKGLPGMERECKEIPGTWLRGMGEGNRLLQEEIQRGAHIRDAYNQIRR